MKSKLTKVEKKAISSKNLQNRLNINKRLGSNDLTKWLFKRYKIVKNDKILELGCGRGNHVIKESKIVGNKGFILGTDLSNKSLNVLKKRIFTKNIRLKHIELDETSNYLAKKKIKFDKIISSYALYYAKNPIKVIQDCSKFLKPNGHFLITAPCYPHTLIEFADKHKILPKEVKKQIDFSSQKLEKFLLKKKIKNKVFRFKNILKFKNKEDLLIFYRSTVFYNKKKEKNLLKFFDINFRKKKYLNILKSAKLYKFTL
tara:strand:+ start:807 stop:1580 length:774 start_codon:yes stop_codon:yes gene_type:complete